MPMTRLALRVMTFPFPAYVVAQAIRIPHPHLSKAMLGRDKLPVHYLMDLAYLLSCEPDELLGWADGGIDSHSLAAELPCIEDGINTAIPDIVLPKLRNSKPRFYSEAD
jgi:hypothetical protein